MDAFQNSHTRQELVLVQYNLLDDCWAERTGYYGIVSTPIICGDGLSVVWPTTWLEPDYQAHSAGTSPITMSLIENDVGDFTAHIVAEEDVTDAKFVMVAVEDDSVAQYGGGKSHLPYHYRTFMTAVTGDTFAIAAGESTDITKTFTVDPSWDYGKMAVVCWVQKPGGTNPSPSPGGDIPVKNQVLQAAYAEATTGVPEFAGGAIALLPPSPNPFRGLSTIEFVLPVGGRTSLELFDVTGRRVAVLVDSDLPAGTHEAVWDGRDSTGRECATGVYFVRLAHTGLGTAHEKIVRMR